MPSTGVLGMVIIRGKPRAIRCQLDVAGARRGMSDDTRLVASIEDDAHNQTLQGRLVLRSCSKAAPW
jgi:hypothetical protein